WVDGERLVAESASGEDLPLVELGITATLLQLLGTGVMHTDPHGGNLLKGPIVGDARSCPPSRPSLPSRQLVYLDFGLVADVPLQVREGLVCAVMYMVERRWVDVASLFHALMLLPDWVIADAATLASFTRDIELAAKEALVFPSETKSSRAEVPSLRFAALLEQLVLLAPRYEFQLPPYFLNNARALGCLEGMARTVDPEFNILQKVYPFALNTLLSNPSDSPVLRETLRKLCSDSSGRLSLSRASSLVDSAARLTGTRWRKVVADSLRSRGGRRFFRALLRSEAAKLCGRVLE
ncbi:ABC1K3, partial [Symbiodinium necroappetens]